MFLSFDWLKEFVDTKLTHQELSEKLTMSGAEVEAESNGVNDIEGVFVAEVLKKEQHPNADRLSYCEVSTGDKTHNIVCGATNFKVGDKIPLATIGAVLTGGFKIKKSKLRGVESEGMMCSESELGLAEESEGLLILPEDTPLGKDIREVLGDGDTVLELSITPNRGDLLSIRGLGKELSAITEEKFKDIEVDLEDLQSQGENIEDTILVEVEEPELCRRYTARVIKGVKVGESPDYIKNRLEKSGLRPINNIVDITNYVMLEIGQPLHGFDLSKIGGGKIVVRNAKEGEKITTLDGVDRVCTESMLLICDGEENGQAVAGVMGGSRAEVSDDTVDLLLESANFKPEIIRRTAKKLQLSSDSSYRFERGVDVDLTVLAINRAAELILKEAGGTLCNGIIDEYPVTIEKTIVNLRLDYAEKILGLTLSRDEVSSILTRLGFNCLHGDTKNDIEVTVPLARTDVTIEADLIEEIARIKGYSEIPTTLPIAHLTPEEPMTGLFTKRRIRDYLSIQGCSEVLNYSFYSTKEVELAKKEGKDKSKIAALEIINPLSEDLKYMRTSLVPSLLNNLSYNVSHGVDDLKIYELGPIFKSVSKGDSICKENWRLALLMNGKAISEKSWANSRNNVDFFDIKGILEGLLEDLSVDLGKVSFERLKESQFYDIGRSATVFINNNKIGTIGLVNKAILKEFDVDAEPFILDIDIDGLMSSLLKVAQYSSIVKFPLSTRDIAFIVNKEIPYSNILSQALKIDKKVIENIYLFDVYYGKNIPDDSRSLALRVVYRNKEKTITSEEVDTVHNKVVELLKEQFKVEIR